VCPDPRPPTSETRFIAIGRDAGARHVFVAFTFRGRGGSRPIRPISARWMHAKEIRHLEAPMARTPH